MVEDEQLVYCLNCSQRFSNKLTNCPACGSPNLLYIRHKDRVTAGLYAVMFGLFGLHKFYLRQYVQGVIYLLFFWTIVPAVLGLVEGIRFLTMSDEQFWEKH